MKKIYKIFFLSCFLFLTGKAQNTFTYNCILRSNNQFDTLCDGRVLPVFGITSSLGAMSKIPAKILYCNEGDSVVLNARSISQGEHHSIHLHGLDVDTRNDGDPATSFWLSHMQDTTYSFRARHAGTYLYHCHVVDVIHVQMGMYGMIVVRAAGGVKTAWTGGPAFDKDRKWLMSEVDSVWHYHVPPHDTIADTVHIGKYKPNYFLINGKCGNEINNDDSIKITGSQNEKILMRLANIGFLSNRIIFPSWLNAQIIDSDGRPLPNAIVSDTCYVMPGERFSVMLQASMQNTAVVNVQYIDMNTGAVVYSNPVPVIINGVYGFDELKKEDSFFVYPNPSDKFLNLASRNKMGEDLNFVIYNTLGQKVSEGKFRDETKIDISNLSSGIYHLSVTGSGNQKLFGSHFIKVN